VQEDPNQPVMEVSPLRILRHSLKYPGYCMNNYDIMIKSCGDVIGLYSKLNQQTDIIRLVKSSFGSKRIKPEHVRTI